MALESVEYLIVRPGTKQYQEYLALRHSVFCEELKRIPSSGASKLETDEFDVYSLHVFCRARDTGEALACSRLILPGPKGLNVSARYALQLGDDVPHDRVAEIGRLALAPAIRRLRNESLRVSRRKSLLEGEERVNLEFSYSYGALVALGMYRQIFRLMGCYGVSHGFAAMEPSLARLYGRIGIPFAPAGPLSNEVVPARRPYLIDLQYARAVLAWRNPSLHSFIVGGDLYGDPPAGYRFEDSVLSFVRSTLPLLERASF
jgi:N-acyl amino acid synthase of PEP-CTERM/exosortase system